MGLAGKDDFDEVRLVAILDTLLLWHPLNQNQQLITVMDSCRQAFNKLSNGAYNESPLAIAELAKCAKALDTALAEKTPRPSQAPAAQLYHHNCEFSLLKPGIIQHFAKLCEERERKTDSAEGDIKISADYEEAILTHIRVTNLVVDQLISFKQINVQTGSSDSRRVKGVINLGKNALEPGSMMAAFALRACLPVGTKMLFENGQVKFNPPSMIPLYQGTSRWAKGAGRNDFAEVPIKPLIQTFLYWYQPSRLPYVQAVCKLAIKGLRATIDSIPGDTDAAKLAHTRINEWIGIILSSFTDKFPKPPGAPDEFNAYHHRHVRKLWSRERFITLTTLLGLVPLQNGSESDSKAVAAVVDTVSASAITASKPTAVKEEESKEATPHEAVNVSKETTYIWHRDLVDPESVIRSYQPTVDRFVEITNIAVRQLISFQEISLREYPKAGTISLQEGELL